MKHVVVVGGGFAGIKLARNLAGDRRFQVTLISEHADFEYHAALYRSATGRSPLEVVVPLSRIFAGTNVDVILDRVEKIDAKNKTVACESGEKYKYDDLVLATGVVTAYFGIEGLSEYSYTMKSMAEALRLKNHLHNELTVGHKPDLSYVIVGAGPSGVELAGELVFYLQKLRRSHGIKKPFKVELVEAAPRILPMMPERFSRIMQRRLENLGVKVYTSTAVKGETADTLQLPEGNIKTHTVIWTAGMTNNPIFADHESLFKLGKVQKVQVDEHLGAGNGIWVLGDSALTDKTGWAQTAVYDGAYLAENLRRREAGQEPKKYSAPNPLAAIPAGPDWCGVNMSGLQIFGWPGWVVRRWADLSLYFQVLPLRLAAKSWIVGGRQEETCSVCRHGR